MSDLFKRLFQFPTQLFLVAIGVVLFLPFIGKVPLFDWDEINFAESAREMLVSGNFRQVQINFQPFLETPPFFTWLQALAMHRYGINEFSARLPNVVFGVLTMLLAFNIGRRYFSSVFGLFWALLMACSFLPFIYFKSGIADPVFNYFVFLSVYWLFRISVRDEFEPAKMGRKRMKWYTFLSAAVCGLAVITKGPVAIVIVVLVVSGVLFWNKGRITFTLSNLIIWFAVVAAITSIWLTYESQRFGVRFLDEFLHSQIHLYAEDSGRNGSLLYHPAVLLIGCFPSSILLWAALYKNTEDTAHQLLLKRWMFALLLVTLILFSIVKMKIVHYSSLAYLPITFLAAYYLHKVYEGRKKWHAWLSAAFLVLGIEWAAVAFIAIYVSAFGKLEWILPYVKDEYWVVALKSANITANAAELVVPILFVVLLIISVVLFHLRKNAVAIGTLFVACAFFVATMSYLFMPRAERISQHAMIDFLQRTAIEKPNYEVRGFKSYAHYFYGKAQPNNASSITYVISKVNLISHIDTTDLNPLYEKNGFVFFQKRKN